MNDISIRTDITIDPEDILDELGTEDIVQYFKDNKSLNDLLEEIGKEACMDYFKLKEDDE